MPVAGVFAAMHHSLAEPPLAGTLSRRMAVMQKCQKIVQSQHLESPFSGPVETTRRFPNALNPSFFASVLERSA